MRRCYGYSDKAKEVLAKSVRSLLRAHGVRQTTNSGYDPANGIAERWVGIIKVRATALLAEHPVSPDSWAYACRWVAYPQPPCVEHPLKLFLSSLWRRGCSAPIFEEASGYRGITGVCLGHNPLVSGGVAVGTITHGL